ncbi:MAG: hypothetical protein ACXWCZ_10095, partial [Flavisolibacter sp.]
MSESNKYGTIINEKFSDFSFQDMDTTWLDMKDILDKEMPHNKKRRFLLWLNWYTGIALFVVGLTVFTLIMFNQKSNENIGQKSTITKPPASHDEHANSQSVSIEIADEPKTQTTPKTVLIETRVNSKNTKINKSDPPKAANISNKEYSINKPFNDNYTTTPESHQLKTSNEIGSENEQKQGITSSNTHIVADKSINQKTPQVHSPKENIQNNTEKKITEDVVVIYKNKNLSTPLLPVRVEPNKISEQKVGLVELAKKEEVKNLNQISKTGIINTNDSVSLPGSKTPKKKPGKGWVMGASVNYNLPVSNQEMSTVNINGNKSNLIDFLPSVYVQYHFDKKWHVESSFQFSSPQYITNHKLASFYKNVDPNKKEENAIWLNKLYYLNLPVSVHYKILPNMTIGSGIQYSYLRRSIFADEIAIWEKQGAEWIKTSSEKAIKVKSNSEV